MFKDDASPCHIAVAHVHVMTSGWVGRVALVEKTSLVSRERRQVSRDRPYPSIIFYLNNLESC